MSTDSKSIKTKYGIELLAPYDLDVHRIRVPKPKRGNLIQDRFI